MTAAEVVECDRPNLLDCSILATRDARVHARSRCIHFAVRGMRRQTRIGPSGIYSPSRCALAHDRTTSAAGVMIDATYTVALPKNCFRVGPAQRFVAIAGQRDRFMGHPHDEGRRCVGAASGMAPGRGKSQRRRKCANSSIGHVATHIPVRTDHRISLYFARLSFRSD